MTQQQTTQNPAIFNSLGKSFQEKVLQALLTDRAWSAQFIEVFNVDECLEPAYLKLIANRYIGYYHEYKEFPTIPLLVTIMKDELREAKDVVIREQCHSFLQKVIRNEEMNDLPWVKDKAFTFCRQQLLRKALSDSVDIILTDKYEKVVDIMKGAIAAGMATSPGHDYNVDLAARYSTTFRHPIPTGIYELDEKKIMGGGLGGGEIGIVCAPSGVGKCCKKDTKVLVRIKVERDSNGKIRPFKLPSVRTSGHDQPVEILEAEMSLAELFELFGHEFVTDSVMDIRDYDVQVYTDEGFSKVNALYTTPKYESYRVKALDSNGDVKTLECADKHLLYCPDTNCWKYISDLNSGEMVAGDQGKYQIQSVDILSDEPEIMCDIEVEGVHRYFTNGFLSHNSHVLTNFGAQAILLGKNVIHYTMELNERYCGIRYDSNLTGINSSDCSDNQDRIQEFFASNADRLGRLIIKEYPARSITCNTIRAHIEKMSLKGVKPDMIIIDYAGIIRSSERYELPRLEMQYVIQEIRSLAKELDVPIWTALQSNKEGAKSDIVDLTNLAESYGQAAEADFVLGLQRISTQKSTGLGTLFIAKNRFGIDGLQFKIHLDTARSTLRVLSADEIEGMQQDQEAQREQIQKSTLDSFKEAIKKSKAEFQLKPLRS